MFEHTLSLEEHDENAKDFSLPGNQILIYYISSKDMKDKFFIIQLIRF